MDEVVVIVWLTKRGELELQFLPSLYYYQESTITLSLLKRFSTTVIFICTNPLFKQIIIQRVPDFRRTFSFQTLVIIISILRYKVLHAYQQIRMVLIHLQ